MESDRLLQARENFGFVIDAWFRSPATDGDTVDTPSIPAVYP